MAKNSFALSPKDIVIVYNKTMLESRDIALYYAKKREIPKFNLVGLNVTNSERISRLEFNKNMIPGIRAAVKRLKKAGNSPAILLVYGIPLYVTSPLDKEPDIKFTNLIAGKIKEYQNLILKLSSQLDHLLNNRSPDYYPNHSKKSYTTKDVFKVAGESISRATKQLSTQDPKKKNISTHIKLSSILIRLTGISPTGRMAEKQLLEKNSTLMKNKTILQWYTIFKRQLTEIKFRGVLPEKALEEVTIVRLTDGIIGELKFWEKLKEVYANKWTSASVDSELALILKNPYQLAAWLPNPFLNKYNNLPFIKEIREERIMVGRLDGPTPNLAKRLIDDAIEIENTGLNGVFYIDARGHTQGKYLWYDRHFKNLYDIVKKRSSMKVVFDNNPDLFPPGACPNAALYCGWYSLGNYIDAFKWQKGAVGFHVASSEAVTLKRPKSKVWCKRMIEEGVSATLGPVEEPFLSSFPLPDTFFPLLMTGKLTLLEVYFRSTPFLSWRQVLIGDPLYTPFKKNPAIDLTENKKVNKSENYNK
jgi:uncharacterized protein (TIGR03790 family)